MGVALVIGCFLAIGVRAYRAAVLSKHAFTTFFIAGTSAILLVQATFNIAVVLGLVPTKGITLPFVSYGGSSLVMSMFTAGLLLRACADATRGTEAEQAGPNPLSRFAPLRSAAAVGALRSPP